MMNPGGRAVNPAVLIDVRPVSRTGITAQRFGSARFRKSVETWV